MMAKMRSTPPPPSNRDEQITAGLEPMANSRELFPTMGTVRDGDSYTIVNSDLKNVVDPIFPQYFAPGTIDPEILFYKK